MDRHAAARIVARAAKKAGLGGGKISPHTLRRAFITTALDVGVALRDVQEAASHAEPRTTMRYDRARASLDRHATYVVAAYLAGAARQDITLSTLTADRRATPPPHAPTIGVERSAQAYFAIEAGMFSPGSALTSPDRLKLISAMSTARAAWQTAALGSANGAGRDAIVHAKSRPALVVHGEQVEAQVRRVADEQRHTACDEYWLEG